jgi:hypothetical protein
MRNFIKYKLPILHLLWIKSRYKLDDFNGTLPWICEDAVKWLKNNLTDNFKVFEYGSGGSTIFFSKICKEVVSVENDPYWYLKIKNKIKNNCLLYYKSAQPGAKGYSSTDPRSTGKNFNNYVSVIDRYHDNYFDLIFVDGRARNSCLKASISKVKDGGYIMLDNSERPEYVEGIKTLEPFIEKKEKFTDGNSETTVFKIKKDP